MVEKLADKYKIGSIVGASFTMQYGYRFKYCATDVAYAMLAVLESTVKFHSFNSIYCNLKYIANIFSFNRLEIDHHSYVSWKHPIVSHAQRKKYLTKE